MDLPIRWLNDYVDTSDIPIKQYIHKMTMSGSKVEGFREIGAGIEHIVTGCVDAMERHANSDHLWVCTVDTDGGKKLQIVTGAQNVSVGDIVPVAQDGARLPDGKEIRAGELRGVLSEGMLCSHQELGLSKNYCPDAPEHGILILDQGTLVGEDIKKTLMLDDCAVEFEITPNRPDCLGVIGLARETAATFDLPMNLKPVSPVAGEGSIDSHLSVSVPDPDLCPVYTARIVKNIKIEPSPLWMRARLHAAGVRPINNIVDITNYVMLEYGQPMHAFDYACLNGGNIIVRRAKSGERFTTLDSKEYDLEDGMLVIADKDRPVGLAGIMGGLNSEITGDTRMIVFESANFSGPSVRMTSRRLGLRTDASSRFEKGLDAALTTQALERACSLVELLGAGEVVGGRIQVGDIPAKRRVALDDKRINRLLGLSLSLLEMESILRSLGFEIDGGDVIVPTWRGDVEMDADLAEEIARIYGFDNIPATLINGTTTEGGLNRRQQQVRRIHQLCRGMGYHEISTYSFISPKFYDQVLMPADSELRRSVTITNPLGEDTSIMRTTALPSMLGILSRNYNQRNTSARLYETASVYIPKPDSAGETDPSQLPDERQILMLGEYGEGASFFTMKGSIEALLNALRIPAADFVAEKQAYAYHEGRTAKIYCNGVYLGLVGQIHPRVASNYEIDREVYTAELELSALIGCMAGDPVYTPLPKFPATTRDLALLCDESVTSGEIVGVIRQTAEYLEAVTLFDVYRGAQILTGKKSMAYSLVFRDEEATMTDAKVDAIMANVLNALKEKCGVSLR